MPKLARSMLMGVALLAAFSGRAMAMDTTGNAPIDPFDYSQCGGKPVYPVIGFNFSTWCGPRNQIGLGRRGRLMWLFTTTDDRVHASGNRLLTEDVLGELVLLAEAAQGTAPPTTVQAAARHELGMNITG